MTQESPPSTSQNLRPVLANRQLGMIAIGGVIGAGLFVGSGTAIASAGPAVLVAYIGIALLVVLIMRMLAELAVASPESGSFATYASRAFGPWCGVTVSSLYTYQWTVVIGFEATAGAQIIHKYVPGIQPWVAALVVMVAFTITNLISVRAFGEFEFWFALIKVLAICLFLVVGVLAIMGLLPGVEAPGTHNLLGQGFAPHGWQPVWLACLVVFFSYLGAETVTIAAGEAQNPKQAVRRAMRSIILRLITFYVGSVAVVVTLISPGDAALEENGPYAAVLALIGLPHATAVVNIIVLTAVLSMLNSGMYSASRMMFAAARRGELPRKLGLINGRGVPVPAILAVAACGIFTVSANYFFPTDVVFITLLQSTGAIGVVVYFFIAATQLRTRQRMTSDSVKALQVRMWGFPGLSVLVLLMLIGIVVGLAFDPGSQKSLVLSGAATAVALIAGLVSQRRTRGGRTRCWTR
ncbi:amino acid permease [Streptomyces coffeae]|uniref:Amino acid permease n=1 Tax=Streptomyces coffeae TaxID=621382 RepID=A0ABS1NR53_9ACTN|nr:amino acid permease [Streptomyces coffeae]MBL1102593.1 amino acid permease [Streptomyces coffeae]